MTKKELLSLLQTANKDFIATYKNRSPGSLPTELDKIIPDFEREVAEIITVYTYCLMQTIKSALTKEGDDSLRSKTK